MNKLFLLVSLIACNLAHAINFETRPATPTFEVKVVKSQANWREDYLAMDEYDNVRVSIASNGANAQFPMHNYAIYDKQGKLVSASAFLELSRSDYSQMQAFLKTASYECSVSFFVNEETYKIDRVVKNCNQ